ARPRKNCTSPMQSRGRTRVTAVTPQAITRNRSGTRNAFNRARCKRCTVDTHDAINSDHSASHRSTAIGVLMNKLVKIGVATLVAGAGTLAAAQNSSPSFAEEFAILQSYSGTGQMYHPVPKTFDRSSDDPATPLSVSEMQALSSESSMYQPDQGNVHPSNG